MINNRLFAQKSIIVAGGGLAKANEINKQAVGQSHGRSQGVNDFKSLYTNFIQKHFFLQLAI